MRTGRSTKYSVASVVALAILFTFVPAAHAQISAGGVYIDPQGMVGYEQRGEAQLKRDYARRLTQARRASGDLLYISLPRLFDAVEAELASSGEVSDATRYLHGLVELCYLFIFPARGDDPGDVVIAGPFEPVEHREADPDRPVGERTGRPVVRLDDLVELLRLLDRSPNAVFGCSIDPPRDIQQRVNRALAGEYRPRSAADRQRQHSRLVDTVGPQSVRYFGLEPDSPVSRASLEADFMLKRLALGLDPPPVTAVRYRLATTGQVYSRWWFNLTERPLGVSPDGLSFEFGQSLRLGASSEMDRDVQATPDTERYAELFTEHFALMSAGVPEFAALDNVTDLALLIATIRHERLGEAAGLDRAWAHDPQTYAVKRLPGADATPSLVSYQSGTYGVGGVSIRVGDATRPDRREPVADGRLEPVRHRPDDGEWWAERPATETP